MILLTHTAGCDWLEEESDWFLTNNKQQVVVAELRADAEVFVWKVSAGHVDGEQRGGLLPDGELLAGQVSAAGPCCDDDLVSVEATA